ncbi:MAG: porin [Pseudomonadota bacterium]|nr:porin [Pseudomonadota bacterium]
MKKLLLATAVSALSLATLQAAHADVTVYGKAHLTVDHIDEDGKDKVLQLNSNASRLGFKGSEKISEGLDAIYQLEYEVDPDADGTVFKQRDSFLGLKGAFGTVKAGNIDTPVKQAQNKVDVFNDLVDGGLDMKNTMVGENRDKNSVHYTTPKMDGLPVSVTLATSLHENNAKNNKSDNALYASGAFEQDGVYGAVAYGKDTKGLKTGPDANGARKDTTADIIRVVGQLNLAKMANLPLTLGALYQTAEPSDSKVSDIDAENAFLVSAALKVPSMEKLTLKAQYQMATTEYTTKGMADREVTQYGVGFDYKLSKNVTALGYVANRNVDTGAADADYMVVGTGLEYKF